MICDPIMLPPADSELVRLVELMCDGVISPTERDRLESMLEGSCDAQLYYVAYLDLHAQMQWLMRDEKHGAIDAGDNQFGLRDAEAGPTDVPHSAAIIPQSSFACYSSSATYPFIGSAVFSYSIAALILGLGLLLAQAWKLSENPQFAAGPAAGSLPLATHAIVGRITGMVDCRFAKASKTEDQRPKTVSLGDKLDLASGLLEITYETGARVILQGPVAYEVESPAGGFLSVGRLTAKLDGNAKRGTLNAKLPGSSSAFIVQPSAFVVRTPTAVVTDLGTEFGVEVDKHGTTTSQVFRGAVRVQPVAANGRMLPNGCILRENESAWVDAGRAQRRVVMVPGSSATDFVREIPRRTIKVLDLVDVVAGGDGFSGRRDHGIDAGTGQVTTGVPSNLGGAEADRTYHRVLGRPLIDGVFVPDARTGRVQLDSAGHICDLFPATAYQAADYIRPVQPVPATNMPADVRAACTTLAGIDYSLPGHAGLLMHANKGITFDLQAIRRANPGWRLVRFLAAAGNTEPVSVKGEAASADVWVFIDGQPRFRRREINSYNGAASVKLPIGPNDRFLTLVATDGGNGIAWDWIMFGDPRIELTQHGGSMTDSLERSK
jgi:hypothetical protein